MLTANSLQQKDNGNLKTSNPETRVTFKTIKMNRPLNAVETYQKRVFDTCIGEGLSVLHSKIITSQATHESGMFSSSLFKRANNIFGMTIPTKRSKRFISGSAGKQPDGSAYYAKYDSLENSVRDLIDWHKFKKTDWNKINSIEDYAAYLKSKGYYGDTQKNYTKALLRYLPGLEFIATAPIPAVVASLAVVLFITMTILYFSMSKN